METIEAIHGRRSVRDYLPRAVDQSLIEAIIDDATHVPWTPVSGPEPWMFNVICGAARIQSYGERALQFARDNRPQRDGYGWTERPDFSIFFNATTVIIISGKAGNPVALDECTRAGQTLAIASFARGLGTCWVGSPMLWLGDPDVRAELLIPDGFVPHAVFTLGYAATILARPSVVRTPTIWLGDDDL